MHVRQNDFILGYTLFSSFINDLPNIISSVSILINFLNTISDGFHKVKLGNVLEKEDQFIVNRGKQWILNFNASKSNLLYYGHLSYSVSLAGNAQHFISASRFQLM